MGEANDTDISEPKIDDRKQQIKMKLNLKCPHLWCRK